MSRKLLTLSATASLFGSVAMADAPQVAVDIAPVHSLVARVMDGVGTPELIISQGASPHEYNLRPSEAGAVQNADLVFWIGEDLTPWLEGALETLAEDAVTVSLLKVDKITRLGFRESTVFEAHDHGDHDDHGDHKEHGQDDHGHDEEHHDHGEHAHGEHGHDKHHDDEHYEHGHKDHAEHHDEDHEDHENGEYEHKHEDHADKHHGHGDHEGHDHEEHGHEDHAEEHHEGHEEHGHEDHGQKDHDDHEDHADGHEDHAHGAYDPHAWLSPDNADVWMNSIAAALSSIDPENASTYFGNAAAGREELAKLKDEINTILEEDRGKSFVVFHDAYQYFESAFDFQASGAISLSDASDPSPARIAEIRDRVKNEGVVCVLSEPQYDQKLVNTVMDGTPANTGVLDPLGVELDLGQDLYPNLLRNLATVLAECL